MAKRVEKITELKCLTSILEDEIPNIDDLEEGDIFCSDRLKLVIVVSKINDQVPKFIVFYANGERKRCTPKNFKAYLASIGAIPSHKTILENFTVH